jgi:hypothetical protein
MLTTDMARRDWPEGRRRTECPSVRRASVPAAGGQNASLSMTFPELSRAVCGMIGSFVGAYRDALGVLAASAACGIGHCERVSVRAELPGFVTHYHLPGRRPFLSLSDLGDAELAAVLADLGALRRAGKQYRPFGPRYMQLRRRTEVWLHEMFVAAGGRPERPWPHYFVLGDSPWYAGLAKNMQRIQLPLSALPPGQTTITYPDSFTAMGLGIDLRLGRPPRACHGRVFLLGELPSLVEQIGMPDPSSWCRRYQTWTTWPADAYIEVQLWSDEPIRDYLPC